MKKLLLALSMLVLPLVAYSQATTGAHRVNQVIARQFGGVTAQVVPGATVAVTVTATGSAATIYQDPLLTIPIVSGTVTTDVNGNYSYYFALNTCLTETVSSPGQGSSTTPNICSNGGSGGGLPVNNPTFTGTMTGGVYGQNFVNPAILPAPQTAWSVADWKIGLWNGQSPSVGVYPGQMVEYQKISYNEWGHNLAQPPVGPQGWTYNFPKYTNYTNRSLGQFHNNSALHWNYGGGDHDADAYSIDYDWGWDLAPSDEGQYVWGAWNGGESSTTCTTTILAGGGGSGATTLKTNAGVDCVNAFADNLAGIGDGHPILDISDPLASGTLASHTTASGETPETYTMTVTGGAITPSTAQGVLNGDCTPTNNLNGPQTQSVTCPVTLTSSVTNVTSSGGSGMTAGTYPLVFGSGTAAGTITVTGSSVTGVAITNPGVYTYGVAPTVSAATGGTPPTLTAIVNSGSFVANGLVSFSGQFHEQATITSVSGTAPNQTITLPIRHGHESTSWIMQGGTQGYIVFTANIGDGLKYPVTILGATSSTTVVGRPFIYANSPGNTGTAFAGPLANGGSQAFTIYPGGEVTDIQDTTGSPPTYAVDGTITIEPSPGAWPNGATVEFEHAPAPARHLGHLVLENHNPGAVGGAFTGWAGLPIAFTGAGIVRCGGGVGTFNCGSFTDGAFLPIANNEDPTNYTYWGGFNIPPSFIQSFGPVDSLLEAQFAPTEAAIFIGCPENSSRGANCNDPLFSYDLWRLQGAGGAYNRATYTPNLLTINHNGLENYNNTGSNWYGGITSPSGSIGILASGNFSNYVPMSVASSLNSFTGSISVAVLTVTAVAPGSGLAVGHYINGAGITPNTYIIQSLGTGTGQTGTYNLNLPLSISSEAMTSTVWTSVGPNAYASVVYNTTDVVDPNGGHAATKLVGSSTAPTTGNQILVGPFPTPLPANTQVTVCLWSYSPGGIPLTVFAGSDNFVVNNTSSGAYNCGTGSSGSSGFNSVALNSYVAGGAIYIYGVNVSLAATPSAGFDTTGYLADVTPHFGANAPIISGVPAANDCAKWVTPGQIGDAGAGCGSGTVSGQANNVIPLGTGTTAIGAQSPLSVSGGDVVSTDPISMPSLITGTPSSAALAALPSGAHGIASDETTTAGVPASAVDYQRADATNHCYEVSLNGSAESCGATGTNTLTLSNKTIPVVTITTGATPAIVSSTSLQTIALSANATPTISGIAVGQRVTFEICQPASGGPYTWTWPASVHGGMTIGVTASDCSIQTFDSFSGTTLVAESLGITNVAP